MPPPRDDRYICITPTPSHADSEGDDAGGEPAAAAPSEKFTSISPGERGRLFAASVKLLQFALRAVSASASDKDLTEEEGALLRAIRPLVKNADWHFLAALTALVQSILEGRTDCPISGVFGAGKKQGSCSNDWGLWWSQKKMLRHMPLPSTSSLSSSPPPLKAKWVD